ncbi:MAG: Fic family protein, partial [Oscillospiraceae bacterium]|nr:Fic family protein [Oscillospiraceae bacterium]
MKRPNPLLSVLRAERKARLPGGIYHKVQVDLTYNTNRIEGSRLTYDQTRYIFETNTVGVESESLNVDDIIETANHFRCIDAVIDGAEAILSERFIKGLHKTLKTGTSDGRKDWFAIGEYKSMPNEVGGMGTALPEDVRDGMKNLLVGYNSIEKKTLDDVIGFHVRFERIHPFQ